MPVTAGDRQPRLPGRVGPIAWVLSAIGACSLTGAFWEAVGPFTVQVPGESFGCGSPFLGRWIGSGGDPGATLAYKCLRAAPGHRYLTFLLAGIGLTCVLGTAGVIVRVSGGLRGSLRTGRLRGPMIMSVCAGLAGVVLLAGATFAELRVSPPPGGVGNPPRPTIPPPVTTRPVVTNTTSPALPA